MDADVGLQIERFELVGLAFVITSLDEADCKTLLTAVERVQATARKVTDRSGMPASIPEIAHAIYFDALHDGGQNQSYAS